MNYPKDVLITSSDKKGNYYLIPTEWITNKELEFNYFKSEYGVYVSSRNFSNILNSIGKTVQEWYDRWILNIETADRPKCPICGNDLEFIKVTLGYRTTCSKKCNAIRCLNNSEFYNTRVEVLNSYESQALNKYNQFVNIGNETDRCILYLGITNKGNLKYGITNLQFQDKLGLYTNKEHLITIHKITEGTRLQIAKLEYNIKLERKDSNEILDFCELHNLISILKYIAG